MEPKTFPQLSILWNFFYPTLIYKYHFQGAARRVTTQKKNVEIESVAAGGKPETKGAVKKYFRLEVPPAAFQVQIGNSTLNQANWNERKQN